MSKQKQAGSDMPTILLGLGKEHLKQRGWAEKGLKGSTGRRVVQGEGGLPAKLDCWSEGKRPCDGGSQEVT